MRQVPEVWHLGGPRSAPGPGVVAVDVTDVFDAKVRACRAHDSQMPMLGRGVEAELRDHLGRTAVEHGLPEGRLAEADQVVDTR